MCTITTRIDITQGADDLKNQEQFVNKTVHYGPGYVVGITENEKYKAFQAVSLHESVSNVFKIVDDTAEKMLIDAVNNRTRQMNYFRLYSELLNRDITEEEFDREIENNPDDYIVKTDKIPNEKEFLESMRLAKEIKGIDSSADIEAIFSFDEDSYDNFCKKLVNGVL